MFEVHGQTQQLSLGLSAEDESGRSNDLECRSVELLRRLGECGAVDLQRNNKYYYIIMTYE